MNEATGYGNGTALMISAPTTGWIRTRSNSLARQLSRLGQDVLRNGELADVVEQRRHLDRFHIGLGHPRGFGERDRPSLHAAHMVAAGADVLDRLIARVDRARQRLDARQMEVRDLLKMPLLLDQATAVQAISLRGTYNGTTGSSMAQT